MQILRKFKFPARSKSPIFFFTVTGPALTTITGGATAVYIFRDSLSNKIATAVEGVVRSSRSIYTDQEPIAAASIAQVHHAVLKNHQQVAVKVQYPGVKQSMKLDTMIMSLLSKKH